jgi:hypothetical protein
VRSIARFSSSFAVFVYESNPSDRRSDRFARSLLLERYSIRSRERPGALATCRMATSKEARSAMLLLSVLRAATVGSLDHASPWLTPARLIAPEPFSAAYTDAAAVLNDTPPMDSLPQSTTPSSAMHRPPRRKHAITCIRCTFGAHACSGPRCIRRNRRQVHALKWRLKVCNPCPALCSGRLLRRYTHWCRSSLVQVLSSKAGAFRSSMQ